MRYQGRIYRPPSDAHSFILQATIGCSWNACTYCDMYRDKDFSVRPLEATLEDIAIAAEAYGDRIEKVFVADGDALVMEQDHWLAVLSACRTSFPRLRRVSAYATAMNLNAKSVEELTELREAGLELLYIGPETGDDVTFKRIAKGANFEEHVQAAERSKAAGIELSAIFLLGAGGTARSQEHATESARLITAMDPKYVSCLTLTVVDGTPMHTQQERGKFELPSVERMLEELRVIVGEADPSHAVFRTNHASNYLPIAGSLPGDRDAIVAAIDAALSGEIALKPEWARGL